MLAGDLDGAVAAYYRGQAPARGDRAPRTGSGPAAAGRDRRPRGDLAKARELSAAAQGAVDSKGSPIDRGIAAAWWAAFEVRWGDVDAARPLQAAAERHLAQFGPAHPAREHLEAMVAATGVRIAIADEDLPAPASRPSARTARRSARRTCRCSRWRRARSAELALALGQPERAAEMLGAGAVVRGSDDPTDPTALKLVPLLRAGLGDDRYGLLRVRPALARPDAIEALTRPDWLGPPDVPAQRQREEHHEQPGDPRERPADLRGDRAAEQQAAHRADQVRERVDVHECLEPAGHRRGRHERVAAERQREDEQEHHALHRAGGAHRHADPQRDPRERQGEADRDAQCREQQHRAGRDAEAERVTKAHQDDAQQQVPEEVGDTAPTSGTERAIGSDLKRSNTPFAMSVLKRRGCRSLAGDRD